MNNTFADVAQQLLGRPLTEKDGLAIEQVKACEARMGVPWPPVLRQFYTTVGNLTSFMSAYEQFVPPADLHMTDGMLTFLWEAEGVCSWGVTPGEDDPIVFMDVEGSVFSEDMALSAFLEMMMYYQFAMCGYPYCATLPDDKLPSLPGILAEWEQVVLHNDIVVYRQPGLLLWYFIEEDGTPLKDAVLSGIFLSARTRHDFKAAVKRYGFQKS